MRIIFTRSLECQIVGCQTTASSDRTHTVRQAVALYAQHLSYFIYTPSPFSLSSVFLRSTSRLTLFFFRFPLHALAFGSFFYAHFFFRSAGGSALIVGSIFISPSSELSTSNRQASTHSPNSLTSNPFFCLRSDLLALGR